LSSKGREERRLAVGKRMLAAAFVMLFGVAWVKAEQYQSQCQHQCQSVRVNNKVGGGSYAGDYIAGYLGSEALSSLGEYGDAGLRWLLSPIFGHTNAEKARRYQLAILKAQATILQKQVADSQKTSDVPPSDQKKVNDAVIESLQKEVTNLQKQVLDAEKRVHEAEIRAIQAKPVVVAPPKSADDDKKADLEKKLETALAAATKLQQQLDAFKAQQVEMARQAEADRKAANCVIADLRKQIEDLRLKAEADERKAGVITTDFQKLAIGLLARAEVAERAAERAVDRSRKVRIVVTHDVIRGGTTTE